MESYAEINKINHVHELMFCTLLSIYSLWRYSKVSKSTSNSYKEKMRKVGAFLIITSITSTFSYNALAYFLNTKFKLDKFELELTNFVQNSYVVNFKDISIDLCNLLNVFYFFSKTLRMSSIFMLIGLWGPCLYSFVNIGDVLRSTSKNQQLSRKFIISKNLFQTSIVKFAKIYTFLRIPFLFFIYQKLRTFGSKEAIFFESFFLSGEIYFCLALFLILRTKHNFVSGSESIDSLTLLGGSLGIYGFLNYTINCISLPFYIDTTNYQVIHSFVFALRLIIDLLLVNVFCPMKVQIFDEIEKNKKFCKNVES